MDTLPASAPAETPRATAAAIHRLKAPARAKAVLLALLNVKGGAIDITLPASETMRFGDDDRAPITMLVKDYRFANRVLKNGDIGFAEAWMAHEWETSDLSALLTLLADNIERFKRLLTGSFFGKAVNWMRHLSRDNTREGSRRNIYEHYDLGNRFYEAWLDPSMTYSSARFDATVSDLEAGQRAKYKALADHLDLKAGDHVLEIG
ncbi:MAG TPA: class I SAM-dependent methyltransferase, partial [Verrucomicrobiae bacterium]|nr:class I SAM-dependent methyltransferase [Verrucomicrobiae bacterium]